jgi:hypothetical protein
VTAIIVDTSAILAIFDESYAEHPAIAQALAMAEDLLVVSPMVVAEADYMLASRLGPKAARRFAADGGPRRSSPDYHDSHPGPAALSPPAPPVGR